MNKDKVRLLHILESIQRIQSFTENGDRDEKTESAVLREITVMGEAARHISEQIKESYPDIPWKNIIGIRNILVHEYFQVEAETVWDTVEHKIPALKSWIEGILEQKFSK